MRKTRPKKRLIQSEINVIPFLDVLLVLLMIFMMIPSKFMHGFEVTLPNSATTDIFEHNKKNLVTIEIIGSGLYNLALNDEYITNIHLKKLSLEINKKKHESSSTICIIAASKSIQYDEVIQILNLLNKLKIHSVGMLTHPINSST